MTICRFCTLRLLDVGLLCYFVLAGVSVKISPLVIIAQLIRASLLATATPPSWDAVAAAGVDPRSPDLRASLWILSDIPGTDNKQMTQIRIALLGNAA